MFRFDEVGALIEVDGLTKHYGHHAAVEGVSFTAARGEILGFLGPNGAGKTTTMRMLTCFLPPTAGTARIAGYDIHDNSLEVRRRLGYLPENVPLYRDLSVTTYLDFVGRLKGMSARDRSKRTSRVMEECGVGDVRDKAIGTLSRGYRQRVGLAQALLNDPEVLILDEPTVGLDPRQIVEIRDLIRGLAGERTIVLSTHILPEVSLICQRVIIINQGVLITDDTPQNLGRHLRRALVLDIDVRGPGDAVAAMIEDVVGVHAVETSAATIEGVAHFRVEAAAQADPREAIAAALVGAGYGLVEMSARDLSLEDIFVHLVTEEARFDV